MSDNIEYLYGNYSGKKKTGLSRDIEITEKILNNQKQSREERLEELFDRENLVRLKGMNVKDMSFAEIDHFNEIKKKYSNVGKAYDGTVDSNLTEIPEEGRGTSVITEARTAIINTTNALIPLIQSRGISVQPIPEGASLPNILSFLHAFRDALTPVSGIEEPDDQPIKYSRSELIEAKADIEKMIRKLDGR